MKQWSLLSTLLLGLLLAACQPTVLVVEVTSTPSGAAELARPVEPAPAASMTPPVREVTRVVPQEVTRIVPEEVVVEVTKAALGSAERPLQLLFPARFPVDVIQNRGQVLADALAAATGQAVAVGVLDSEQAVIDLMCAAPQDTIGFLSAPGYVLAEAQCGVQLGMVALDAEGRSYDTGMLVTRRDGSLRELAALADGSWATADTQSIPNFLYFQALLLDMGVAPGEIMPAAGDNGAMLAVFNGEATFGTATYLPPIQPFEEPWVYGEDTPEPWRLLGIPPRRSPLGYILVNGEPADGGYRLRDARAGVFDIAPEIFGETQIVALSAPMPHAAVAFGAEFPLGLARELMGVLGGLAEGGVCAVSLCAGDFYAWSGLTAGEDALFDALRFTVETLNLTQEEIWALAQ